MATSTDDLFTTTGPSATEPPATGSPVKAPSIALFALANFALWFALFTPFIITLQLKAKDLAPGDPTAALSIVLGFSAAFGIIANPLAGRLSDRTTSRFGMRRPWLIGVFGLGLLGLLLEAVSPNVALLVVAAVIAQIAFAAGLSVLLSVIPDHIPPGRRAFASGLLGVTQGIAVVSGALVAGALSGTSLILAFVLPGIIGFALMVPFVGVLEDRVLPRSEQTAFGWRGFWSSFWTNPLKHRDFGWAWFSRFAIFLSVGGVVNYQLFYLTDQLHMKEAAAKSFIPEGLGVQTVLLIVGSLLAGRLSDRSQRRKVFVVVASVIAAGGLVLFATATSLPQYFLGVAVIGFAQGIYYSVDLALVSDVLPDRQHNAAKDMGVFSIANQLPQTLVPAIAPIFLAIPFGNVVAGSTTNYTALFVASAVAALAAALTILPVRGVR